MAPVSEVGSDRCSSSVEKEGNQTALFIGQNTCFPIQSDFEFANNQLTGMLIQPLAHIPQDSMDNFH